MAPIDKAARGFWRAFWRDRARVLATLPTNGAGGIERLPLPPAEDMEKQRRQALREILERREDE